MRMVFYCPGGHNHNLSFPGITFGFCLYLPVKKKNFPSATVVFSLRMARVQNSDCTFSKMAIIHCADYVVEV